MVMKDTKTQEQELVGPQKALQRYLDDLLQDATEPSMSAELLVENTLPSEEQLAEEPNTVSEDLSFQEELGDLQTNDAALEENEHNSSDSLNDEEGELDALDLSFADFEAAIQPLQQEYEAVSESTVATATVEEDSLGLGLTVGTSELLSMDEQLSEASTLEDLPTEALDAEALEIEDAVEEHAEVVLSSLEDETESLEELAPEMEVDWPSEMAALDSVVSEDFDSDSVESVVENNLAESSLADSDVVDRTVVESDVVDVEAIEPESIADVEPELELKKQVAPTDPLPWAQSRFECLLFYVGKLKLAVPLVELGGIHQGNDEKLTAIFGQPKWFLGMSNVGEFNLRTVDTAKWVMPDHYEGELKEHFKFVIQLDRSDWGLACESVAEAITLEPSAVKWRSDRSRRPWLAGTVIDHMCAILDVQGFITLLEDPDNGFRKHLKHVD